MQKVFKGTTCVSWCTIWKLNLHTHHHLLSLQNLQQLYKHYCAVCLS